jgi:hypothetical protein
VEKNAAYWREYNAKNKLKRANTTRAWQRRIHEEVIAHYGGKCECCYDRTFEFLTVERVLGAQQKREGNSLSYWLQKNHFPEGYRILCWNCSRSIRNGYCPHRDAAI